jgi:hypothetical protein
MAMSEAASSPARHHESFPEAPERMFFPCALTIRRLDPSEGGAMIIRKAALVPIVVVCFFTAGCGGSKVSPTDTPTAESKTATPSSLCRGDEQVFFACAGQGVDASVCVSGNRPVYRERLGTEEVEMAPAPVKSPMSSDLASGFSLLLAGRAALLNVRETPASGPARIRTIEADGSQARLGRSGASGNEQTSCAVSENRLAELPTSAAEVQLLTPPSPPAAP